MTPSFGFSSGNVHIVGDAMTEVGSQKGGRKEMTLYVPASQVAFLQPKIGDQLTVTKGDTDGTVDGEKLTTHVGDRNLVLTEVKSLNLG